jgi:hypothetical protein
VRLFFADDYIAIPESYCSEFFFLSSTPVNMWVSIPGRVIQASGVKKTGFATEAGSGATRGFAAVGPLAGHVIRSLYSRL